MKLSVIIPTCNRPALLEKTLDSLLSQTLPQIHFEVIVVDNEPSDETTRVTHSFSDKIAHLRYVSEPSPGLHNARHKGVLEANADILVFCDDDIDAFPTWLEGISETFSLCPEAVLVGGKSLPCFESAPPAWFECLWDQNELGKVNGWFSLIDLGDRTRQIPAGYVYGCNFSIRRSVLQSCGGFHPDAMPWELKHLRGDGETHISEWISEHGLTVWYNPLASVYHKVPKTRMTFRYLCRRAFLQAVSYSFMITRRQPGFRQRIGPISLRIASILYFQVFRGYGGIRRHWLFLIYGLIWHQFMIMLSPQLKDWITKPDYFECNTMERLN